MGPGSRVFGPGSLVSGPVSWVLWPRSWILGPGSWVLDSGHRVLGPGSRWLGPRSRVLGPGPGSWVLGPRSRILGHGSWFLGPVLGPASWAVGRGSCVLDSWGLALKSRPLGPGSKIRDFSRIFDRTQTPQWEPFWGPPRTRVWFRAWRYSRAETTKRPFFLDFENFKIQKKWSFRSRISPVQNGA